MTIREILGRQKKTLNVITYVGMAIFIPGTMIANNPIAHMVGLIAFAAMFMTMVYSAFAIKCPKCKESLFQLVYSSGRSPFSISEKLKVCPFCRVELDAPFDDKAI